MTTRRIRSRIDTCPLGIITVYLYKRRNISFRIVTTKLPISRLPICRPDTNFCEEDGVGRRWCWKKMVLKKKRKFLYNKTPKNFSFDKKTATKEYSMHSLCLSTGSNMTSTSIMQVKTLEYKKISPNSN